MGIRSLAATAAIALGSMLFAAADTATAKRLDGTPVEMQQRQGPSARPALPPGGWWKVNRPGCEAYVTNQNDTATMFSINGQNYGFRRGPNCNYSQRTGNRGAIWVNM